MKGILLLSIGSPAYAKWTHNMLISIKAVSDIPVHVLTDGNFPAEDFHSTHVDKIIKIDYSDCHDGTKLFPAKAKLSMYKYSEFDETIYLDVDGVVVKDINPLFDECEGFFQVQVNGVSTKEHDNLDASLWVKVEKIFEKYGLPDDAKVPGTNSSFQYFKKSKEAESLYKQALKNLSDPFSLGELRYTWGHSGTQPDELYMNIALAQKNYMPSIKPVLYLRKKGQGPYLGLEAIKKDYYVIGCWGDRSYNHMEISGNGDRSTGLYNKICAENYEYLYGTRKLFNDHFNYLIQHKVYAKPI